MRPRVHTQQGEVEGLRQEGIVRFLGLPFARPPVGDLRRRPPAPPERWDGVRPATRFGPACPQVIPAMFDLRTQDKSEDYLYLNVWTPELGRQARQPVMVWIHGGADLSVLRHVPTAQIAALSHELSGAVPPAGQVHTPANLVWTPLPDDDVLSTTGFPGAPTEVPILLGHVTNEARYFIKPTGTYPEVITDRAVSDAMQSAWIEFARTGVPAGGPTWPRFDPAAPKLTVIADTVHFRPMVTAKLTEIIAAQR
ncbi:carboxylesterase family protein [Nonomuraea sp. NPDC005650]|uniref:carboxylesterase family protein n=1 Tax=Nonomuraea sp. NPDC005650 TaxID=3157045 RepID=UPI0033A4EC7B